MRFVEPKSEGQQVRSIAFRTREQFLKQRTDSINALHSHLQEFGYVAPRGIGHLSRLEEIVEDPNADLPAVERRFCRELIDHIAQLTLRIDILKKTFGEFVNRGATSRRLQTMPGVGPVSALAIETFAPPMEQLRSILPPARSSRVREAGDHPPRRAVAPGGEAHAGDARHPEDHLLPLVRPATRPSSRPGRPTSPISRSSAGDGTISAFAIVSRTNGAPMAHG